MSGASRHDFERVPPPPGAGIPLADPQAKSRHRSAHLATPMRSTDATIIQPSEDKRSCCRRHYSL